jgi:hypothetical protein
MRRCYGRVPKNGFVLQEWLSSRLDKAAGHQTFEASMFNLADYHLGRQHGI